MLIDHVALLAGSFEAGAAALRAHGLGVTPGPYQPFAGTRSNLCVLEFPQYLEVITIEDREVAASTVDGRYVLGCEARGGGVFSWSVLVDDLEAVSARVGVPVHDWTLPQDDGTLRGWRTVGTDARLPFFIDYPDNGDRAGRYALRRDGAGHTCAPTTYLDLEIGGRPGDLADWLGPHDLPLTLVGGPAGIRAATIATADGPVRIT